ncbi:MAG: GAF domain-containing protein [Fimbriimonadaceae bacterium]
MVGLIIRCIGLGAAAGWGILTGRVDPEWLAAFAAVVGSYAVFVWRLEAHRVGTRLVGLFSTVADLAAVAAFLGVSELIGEWGVLILLPVVWGSYASGFSPLIAAGGAAALPIASALYGGPSSPELLPLSATALALAWIASLRSDRSLLAVSRTNGLFRTQRVGVTIGTPATPPQPENSNDAAALLELRESYRQLRDRFQLLERKSRRDRLAARLVALRRTSGDGFYRAIVDCIREVADCSGVALYGLGQLSDTMSVCGLAGDLPKEFEDRGFRVGGPHSLSEIAKRAADHVAAIADESGVPLGHANFVLRGKSGVVGLLVLFESDPDRMAVVRDIGDEIAPVTATLVEEYEQRSRELRRLRRAELLYQLATTMAGAESRNSLAARVVREIGEETAVDQVAIWWIDGPNAILGAAVGLNTRLLEAMSFAEGPGVAGWLAVGAPELWLPDTSDDARLAPEDALKRRIGSFGLVPIVLGGVAHGYLTVFTHRVAGIDVEWLDTIRLVGAELSQAVERIDAGIGPVGGLMTPGEFQRSIQQASERGQTGCLVYLETVRRDQVVERVGRPAFEQAVREIARRLRGRLPGGSSICRREQGDFIVFLKGLDEAAAASWANEATAIASFVGVAVPASAQRVPLAVRAKVAKIGAPAEPAEPKPEPRIKPAPWVVTEVAEEPTDETEETVANPRRKRIRARVGSRSRATPVDADRDDPPAA